jgi:hypothetical protein
MNELIEVKSIPLGRTGIYINLIESLQSIDNWIDTTPKEIRNQQVKNFATILVLAGISLLLLNKFRET